MAEKYFMFDYNEDMENDYSQVEHSAMFRHGYKNGVCYEQYGENSLLVSNYEEGAVTISPGVMRIEGFCYELDAALELPMPSYVSGRVRTDRIVIQLDSSKNFGIRAIAKTGTDGSSTAPDLVREGHIHEMCIAQLAFDGTNATITDTRKDKTLCGTFTMTQSSELEDVVSVMMDKIYPVGSLCMRTDSINPGTLFGGTWVAWGSGRVPVGVNADDTEFNAVEKTGGTNTHILTSAPMPSHTHTQNSHTHTQNSHRHGFTPTGTVEYRNPATSTANATTSHKHKVTANADYNLPRAIKGSPGWWWGTDGDKTYLNRLANEAVTENVSITHSHGLSINHNHAFTGKAGNTDYQTPVLSTVTATNNNTGGGGAHNNLQPYITCYMWKRTA